MQTITTPSEPRARRVAEAWLTRAEAAARDTWLRVGRRYARRLAEQHLVRSAVDDVLALAARRAVPQQRSVQRPLRVRALPPRALAFNGLDAADRAVLRGWSALASRGGPRAEHAASALVRFVRRSVPARREVRRAS